MTQHSGKYNQFLKFETNDELNWAFNLVCEAVAGSRKRGVIMRMFQWHFISDNMRLVPPELKTKIERILKANRNEE